MAGFDQTSLPPLRAFSCVSASLIAASRSGAGRHRAKKSAQFGAYTDRSQPARPRLMSGMRRPCERIFSSQTTFVCSMPVSLPSSMCPLRNLSRNWFPYIPYSSAKSISMGSIFDIACCSVDRDSSVLMLTSKANGCGSSRAGFVFAARAVLGRFGACHVHGIGIGLPVADKTDHEVRRYRFIRLFLFCVSTSGVQSGEQNALSGEFDDVEMPRASVDAVGPHDDANLSDVMAHVGARFGTIYG